MALKEVLKILLSFLKEDLDKGDITSSRVLDGSEIVDAEVVAKEDGVLSGLEESILLLKHFGIEISSDLKDGDTIKSGTRVLKMRGNASQILKLERLILNLMMRMSGIATATKELVEVCENYDVKVAATRKTTPGFRHFEKKAVMHGGGATHRMGLYDAVLIKDNHVAIVGLEEAVRRAKKAKPSMRIEVEVSSASDALKACQAGADVIMLDNMSPSEVSGVFLRLEKAGVRDKVLIEISGGLTPENAEKYAKLGPDIISSGYVTTKAKWLDMSLKVESA